MKQENYKRFEKIKFDDFKKMAKDQNLSIYEKIGCPISYRQNKEKFIFEDILSKLTNLQNKNMKVLDIGCGCTELPIMIMNKCETNNSELYLMDCEEMLSLLPEKKNVNKIPCYFPSCESFLEKYAGKFDAIIAYGVVNNVFFEQNIFNFIDQAMKLLNAGGEFLIGDIPNISKRKRFFSSENGIDFHKKFTNTDEIPEVIFNQIEEEKIDDSVILGIFLRARNQGFDAYIIPQPDELPMTNRREDILIKKP